MISKKTINAIEVCVFLAGQRHAGYVTTTELSPRLDLSISYLENILKPLPPALATPMPMPTPSSPLAPPSSPFRRPCTASGSARMLGSTRRSGYPSDSSRRRRSQRVDGLTAASTPATRRPPLARAGGLAMPPRPDGARRR